MKTRFIRTLSSTNSDYITFMNHLSVKNDVVYIDTDRNIFVWEIDANIPQYVIERWTNLWGQTWSVANTLKEVLTIGHFNKEFK